MKSTRSLCEGLLRTKLFSAHQKVGCKFVDFAGFEMPVTYNGLGVTKEHEACRTGAAVFDVSHMGQWMVKGKDREKFWESVTPIDFEKVSMNAGSLTVITNETGGIKDDAVIMKRPDSLYVVVNAGCKVKDWEHIEGHMQKFEGEIEIEEMTDYGLLALQGPKALGVLQTLLSAEDGNVIGGMKFMEQVEVKLLSIIPARITRCGYTGEDGFEVSVPNCLLERLFEALMENGATPAGLGARDTLRLEAGLCLYGNDMDENCSPIEASLNWLISKRRRAELGFVGAETISDHLTNGVTKKRVCMTFPGPPARNGAPLLNEDKEQIGVVTSGTFSPTLRKNIAMGFVQKPLNKSGSTFTVEVRNKHNTATVVKAPFVPHNYAR